MFANWRLLNCRVTRAEGREQSFSVSESVYRKEMSCGKSREAHCDRGTDGGGTASTTALGYTTGIGIRLTVEAFTAGCILSLSLSSPQCRWSTVWLSLWNLNTCVNIQANGEVKQWAAGNKTAHNDIYPSLSRWRAHEKHENTSTATVCQSEAVVFAVLEKMWWSLCSPHHCRRL